MSNISKITLSADVFKQMAFKYVLENNNNVEAAIPGFQGAIPGFKVQIRGFKEQL